MSSYIYAFTSVLAVSAVSLVGMFILFFNEEFMRRRIFVFVGLAVGALLGDAFIHLIPESLENFKNDAYASLLIIAGIAGFFVLEKFLHWHHHGEDEKQPHLNPVGKLVLFSDSIHNLIDGVIIGASFIVSVPVGVATTIAVVLHEIPQEVGDFMVLLHSGYSAKRALWLNFLSALCAVIGVAVVFILGQVAEGFTALILPVAAGGFIYIAVADLIPELQKTKEIRYSISQIAAIIVGVLAMLALLFIE